MLNLKTLSSGVAAAAMVSVLGLAYAQTSSTPPASNDMSQPQMPAQTQTTTQSPNSMPNGNMGTDSGMRRDSTLGTDANNSNSRDMNVTSQRAPQADRN